VNKAYVTFNENVGKISGKDNVIENLHIEFDPIFSLANYQFLYFVNISM